LTALPARRPASRLYLDAPRLPPGPPAHRTKDPDRVGLAADTVLTKPAPSGMPFPGVLESAPAGERCEPAQSRSAYRVDRHAKSNGRGHLPREPGRSGRRRPSRSRSAHSRAAAYWLGSAVDAGQSRATPVSCRRRVILNHGLASPSRCWRVMRLRWRPKVPRGDGQTGPALAGVSKARSDTGPCITHASPSAPPSTSPTSV